MAYIKDDRAAPLLAPDLAGLPPCLLVTAEFDPLRDEGADYARHLEAAGVPTEYKCYEGGGLALVSHIRICTTSYVHQCHAWCHHRQTYPTREAILIVIHRHVFVPRVLCLLLREDKRIVRRLNPCHNQLRLNLMAWMESQRGSSGPVWQY